MSVDLPAVGYVKGDPKLVRSVSTSRGGKRAMAMVEYADPFWQMDVQTMPLTREERAAMRAFIDQVNSGMVTIVFAPAFLGVPQAYWTDEENAALSNDGALVSVTGGVTVAMNSVTNGLTLTTGDWLGLVSGDYRSLHRVITGGVASGNALSVVVEPAVPGYIVAGAVAKFKGMGLNARMLPGSDQIGDEWVPTASFTLVEVPK